VALTAAERMRRSRERRRAAERALLDRLGVRGAVERAAAEQLDRIAALLAETGQAPGGSALERALAGSAELVLRLYGNPLVRMAELASAPTGPLAAALGAEPLEVRKLQHQADEALADRLFGRPRQQQQADGGPTVAVQINLTPKLAQALDLQGEVLAVEANGHASL
jgi:hypothetical protein